MDTILVYTGAAVFLLFSLVKSREKTKKALLKALRAFENIMPQFLAVLVLVSIALAVFDPETISRFLGEGSGIRGTLAAAVVGSVTLIPGFVAFPAAAELLRGGAGILQISAFVSSLMMVGIVTLPMEIKFFGRRTAIVRNSLAFFFSLAAAAFVSWAVSV
jgi:uncharacterized membrane protein YraQ (UPF0718 family)